MSLTKTRVWAIIPLAAIIAIIGLLIARSEGIGPFGGPTALAAVTADDHDGDGIPDDIDPDDDNDGFLDTVELAIGTDPLDACADTLVSNDERGPTFAQPLSPWPPDLDDNQTVNILDILQLTPPVFNSSPPNPNYSLRKDLDASGAINILDIFLMTPPVFNTTCDNMALSRGVDYLADNQNPNGSWGPPATAVRDTVAVLQTLETLGEIGNPYHRGLSWLRETGYANNDDLARGTFGLAGVAGDDVSGMVDDLLAGRHGPDFDPAALNYPEGGWGLGASFGSDPLTTALGLRALDEAGLPTGLTVVGGVAISGTPGEHSFTLPGGASDLTLLMRDVTGEVRVNVQTPTSGTFFVDVDAGDVPTTIGWPTEAGTYNVSVESVAGSPNTYSLEFFFTAAGFDVSQATDAAAYLGVSQNPDCGWPISKGGPSNAMVTAEVLLTLQGLGGAFGPASALSCAVDYLETLANADGGVGTGDSTPYETALALLAQASVNPNAANYLLKAQNNEGGWNNPYSTAVALAAIDASGLPDSITIAVTGVDDEGETGFVPDFQPIGAASAQPLVFAPEEPVLPVAQAEEILEAAATADPAGAELAESLAVISDLLAAIADKADAGESAAGELDRLRIAWSDLVLRQRDLIRDLERQRDGLSDAEASARLKETIAGISADLEALEAAIGISLTAGTDGSRLAAAARAAIDAIALGSEPAPVRGGPPDEGPEAVEADPVEITIISDPVPPAATTPPGPADLLPLSECEDSLGDFPQEIVDTAALLGNDPVRIYEFVRNQHDYELYFGAMKGCLATLQTGAGNDYDQAVLLGSLLRASGVPARFIRGTVDISTDDVMDWLGVTDQDVPNSALNTAGVSAVPVIDGPNIVFYRIDRLWVDAYVPYGNYRGAGGDTSIPDWVSLDPAFKSREYQDGIPNMPTAVPFDRVDFLSDPDALAGKDLPSEFYEQLVRDYLETSVPGKTIDDVPYDGPVAAQSFGLLPSTLPYDLVSLDDEFTELPDSLRHKVTITLTNTSDLFGIELATPEVALQRKTISFVAATPADQTIIDGFGGLSGTPCGAVDLTPQFKLDGALAADGPAVEFCDPLTYRVDFTDPEGSPSGSVEHALTAGDHASVSMNAGQVSDAHIADRIARLIAANEDIGTPQEDADELTGELLNIAGLTYFRHVVDGEDRAHGLYGFGETRGVSEGMIRSSFDVDYLFDRPFGVTPGSLVMDQARHSLFTFALDGDDSDQDELRRLTGLDGSALEHATWEELTGIESVSTVKVLQLAYDAGEPVHVDVTSNAAITCKDAVVRPFTDCLLAAGVSAGTVAGILDELNAGMDITVPEAEICSVCTITLNQWQGTGYISETPGTGSGAYIISGGLASNTQGTSATSEPESSATAVRPVSESVGQQAMDGLPTTEIASDEDVFALNLPPRLAGHVRSLIAAGHAVSLSEVVIDASGSDILPYRVTEAGTGRQRYYYFDTVQGGAGTEDPPFPEGLPPGSEGIPIDPDAQVNDPTNVVNGNMIQQVTDISLKSPAQPIFLVRFYNSRDDTERPFGFGWNHNYNDFLVENPDDSVTWFRGDGGVFVFTQNLDLTYNSPDGLIYTLTKGVSEFTLTARAGMTNEYDVTTGRLLTARDRNDNELTFTYDGSDRLSTVSDVAGRGLTFAYDANDHITSVTDHDGRTWTYTYEADGNLASVTTPTDVDTAPTTTSYDYHTAAFLEHNLKTITDPRSNDFNILYYANDKTFQERGPEITIPGGAEQPGATYTYFYDPDRFRTRVVGPNGNETTYVYDDRGLITSRIFADGTSDSTVWDADGRRSSYTDPLGNTTTFTYDADGNLATTTNALSQTVTLTYEPAFNQMDSITRGSAVTTFDHDASGNITSITDPLASVTDIFFDEPARNPSPFNGLRTRMVEGVGGGTGIEATTLFEYDADGNAIRVTDPLGNDTVYGYDDRGNIISVTDEEGRSTTNVYDALDRLIRTTDDDGGITEYDHDLAGNATSIIDALGNETLFFYDEANRLTGSQDPLGHEESLRFDAAGNVVQSTDRNGQTITYEYDPLNRLVRKVLPGNEVSTYTYDAVGSLTSAADPDSLVTMTYDELKRMETSSTVNSPTVPGTILTFGYNAAGQRSSLHESTTGTTTTYTYDVGGNPLTITAPVGTITLDYDERSRRTLTQFPNGNEAVYTWDADSLMTSVTHRVTASPGTIIAQASYAYDGVGNAGSITDQEGTHTYTYDDINRLLTADQPPASGLPDEAYTYGPTGNRATSHLSAAHEYDAANALVGDDDFTYAYDANGNLTTQLDTTGEVTYYTYDAENLLTRVETFASVASVVPTSTTTLRYDGMGRRIEKCVDGACSRYVHDGNEAFMEFDGNNVLRARYLRGPGLSEPLAVQRDLDLNGSLETTSFYHADGVGNVRALTNAAGAVVERYTYDSYGNTTVKDGGGTPIGFSAVLNPFTYTGAEFDAATGLYYLHARYYDPRLGRFLQRDPIGILGGDANLYAYVGNNPVLLTDPSGFGFVFPFIQFDTAAFSARYTFNWRALQATAAMYTEPLHIRWLAAGNWWHIGEHSRFGLHVAVQRGQDVIHWYWNRKVIFNTGTKVLTETAYGAGGRVLGGVLAGGARLSAYGTAAWVGWKGGRWIGGQKVGDQTIDDHVTDWFYDNFFGPEGYFPGY